jgi:hypothetical protein
LAFKKQSTTATNEYGAEEDRKRELRDNVFRQKVALQQFMNHNVPLFRAFANKGVRTKDILKGEVLQQLVTSAIKLATQTAANIHQCDPNEIDAAQARPFRYPAAQWVAAHWTTGKLLDIQEAASQIAGVAVLADHKWAHDPYKDGPKMSANTSIVITAANVASTLFDSVKNYDFRLGTEKVFEVLIEAVITQAEKNAPAMLPAAATQDDVHNLTQTLANNMATLMQACYDQKAREVLKAIRGKPETYRLDYLAKTKPLDAICNNFREWATCVSGMSILSAKRLNEVKPDPLAEAKNRTPE